MERSKLFLLLYALLACTSSHAVGTYTVLSTNDTCSSTSFEGTTSGELRWAISQANADPGSTINFNLINLKLKVNYLYNIFD